MGRLAGDCDRPVAGRGSLDASRPRAHGPLRTGEAIQANAERFPECFASDRRAAGAQSTGSGAQASLEVGAGSLGRKWRLGAAPSRATAGAAASVIAHHFSSVFFVSGSVKISADPIRKKAELRASAAPMP